MGRFGVSAGLGLESWRDLFFQSFRGCMFSKYKGAGTFMGDGADLTCDALSTNQEIRLPQEPITSFIHLLNSGYTTSLSLVLHCTCQRGKKDPARMSA